MNIKSLATKLFASGKINKRNLKYGSFATALTVFFIVAVVLLNVVTTMLFDRFPMSLDLTANSIYSVSQETIDYIEGIESAVDITVIASEDEYRSISDYTVQCAELLEKYEQYNPNISVSYKNILTNPDFVANYTQIAQGDIIVELAGSDHERYKVVSLTDIINVPEDYATYLTSYDYTNGSLWTHSQFVASNLVTSSNAEQAITSALMSVTDANPITVAVLSYTGGNESDVSGLTNLLDKNGYVIKSVNIQTEELTEEIDVIVIPGPKLDYTTQETAKIETWLTNGGVLGKHMIYVASVEQPKTPNLDSLLYRYGLTVEYKVIFETDTTRYSANPNYTFQTIATENHLEDVSNKALPIYVPNARPISTRFELDGGYNSNEALVKTSNSAVLKDMFVSDDAWKPENETDKNSYASVVLAYYKALNQDTHISTYNYILAIGSPFIVDPVVVSASQYNNGDLLLSVINEFTGKTEGITIVPKVVSASTFEITKANINTLTLIFAAVIPVTVFVVGALIWIRRRHK